MQGGTPLECLCRSRQENLSLALAGQLNARAPNALASIKELLHEAPHAQLTHHLAHERDHFVKNLHHPNAGAGISAFLEKRVPRYE